MRNLVLVGAGHAHVAVLRRFGLRPVAGVRLTLITRARHTPYSGMLPGLVAGQYGFDEAYIDTAPLARHARARLCVDEAVGLDLPGRSVLCRDGPPVPFDLLSLDTGPRPNAAVPGVAGHAIPVKPIDGFLARFAALRLRVLAGQSSHVLLVGGGPGGVELLLAVERRLRRDTPGRALRFTLVAEADILPGFPLAFRARLRAVLRRRGITVHAGTQVVQVRADGVVTAAGEAIAADEVLWTTEAAPAAWLADAGLALDEGGFLRVDAMLRAAGRADVFAAGDMVAFDPAPAPRAGVYAVRAGPLLAANLRATLLGTRLRRYRPQRHALAILSTGEGQAVITRNGLVAEGEWAWRLKDRIDRRFMARRRRPLAGRRYAVTDT